MLAGGIAAPPLAAENAVKRCAGSLEFGEGVEPQAFGLAQ